MSVLDCVRYCSTIISRSNICIVEKSVQDCVIGFLVCSCLWYPNITGGLKVRLLFKLSVGEWYYTSRKFVGVGYIHIIFPDE